MYATNVIDGRVPLVSCYSTDFKSDDILLKKQTILKPFITLVTNRLKKYFKDQFNILHKLKWLLVKLTQISFCLNVEEM